jgi:hypothetical protein
MHIGAIAAVDVQRREDTALFFLMSLLFLRWSVIDALSCTTLTYQ